MALWLVLAALLASLTPPALGAGIHDLCVQQALQADSVTPTAHAALPTPADNSQLPLCSSCADCTFCSHGVALASTSHPARGVAPSLADQPVAADRSPIRTVGAALVSARGPPPAVA